MMLFSSETEVFTQVFCFGMAAITIWEAIQSYPLLITGNPKQLLLGYRRVPNLKPNSFIVLSITLSISLTFAGLDILRVPLLVISFLLYFLVYGQLEFLSRKTNLYPFVLFFLLVIPLLANENLKALNGDEWTILFVKTTLCLVYFSSFIQKVKISGVSWINGEKLINTMRYHDLLNDSNWSKHISSNPLLVKLTSLLTYTFEAFFWVSLFFPHYDYFFGLFAIGFHFIILLVLRINYLWYYLPILIIYFL